MEVSLIKVASPFVGMGMGGGVWGGVRAEVIVSVGKGYLCPGGHLKNVENDVWSDSALQKKRCRPRRPSLPTL